ncbi:MAG: acetyl-CoA carboxylase biotin carboxyl carrier protein [Thermoanaerobaculia bacterium]
MNFKEILELIDKVAERGVTAVEIEQAGTRIRIDGKPAQPTFVHAPAGEVRYEPQHAAPMSPAATEAARVAEARAAEEESEAGLHIITSPIVGTFYRAPNPEASSFVNVGDRITNGKVLCIVEAMKLMNEIESDIEGSIVKIYPQNGQPVEYGEKLFAVKV